MSKILGQDVSTLWTVTEILQKSEIASMLPVGRATSSFAYGLVSDWLNECYLLVMGLTVPKVTSKAVDRHFFSRMLLGICCLIIKHNKCGLFKLLLVKTDDSERS